MGFRAPVFKLCGFQARVNLGFSIISSVTYISRCAPTQGARGCVLPKFSASAGPGLFAGWRFDSGPGSFREVYLVLDYQKKVIVHRGSTMPSLSRERNFTFLKVYLSFLSTFPRKGLYHSSHSLNLKPLNIWTSHSASSLPTLRQPNVMNTSPWTAFSSMGQLHRVKHVSSSPRRIPPSARLVLTDSSEQTQTRLQRVDRRRAPQLLSLSAWNLPLRSGSRYRRSCSASA